MVRQKVGVNPPQLPPRCGELNLVEFDLQVHRDETSAKFSEIHEFMESMRALQNSFRSEILEELRQLRVGAKTPVSAAEPIPMQFGTLPSSSRLGGHSVGVDTSSSSTQVVPDANIRHSSHPQFNLSHHDVILGLNSAHTTIMIASPINGNVVVGNSEHVVAGNVGNTGLMWKNGTQTHYF